MKKSLIIIVTFLTCASTIAQHRPLKKVDVASIKESFIKEIKTEGRILVLRFNPDADRIAFGGKDKKISTFSLNDGSFLWEAKGPEYEPMASVNLPSGNPMLIVAQNSWVGGSIFLLNWETGENLGTLSPFDSGRSGIDFFGITGKSAVVWGGSEGKVFEYNFTESEITNPSGATHHNGKVYSVAYGPYGNIFSGGADGKVVKGKDDGTQEIMSFENPVLSIATNPYIKGTSGNDIFIAAGDNRGNVKVKHLQTGEEFFSTKLENECRSIRFHTTDPDLVIVASKSKLYFIDFSRGKVTKTLDFAGNEVWSMDISMDGSRLALGMENGAVKIFQL